LWQQGWLDLLPFLVLATAHVVHSRSAHLWHATDLVQPQFTSAFVQLSLPSFFVAQPITAMLAFYTALQADRKLCKTIEAEARANSASSKTKTSTQLQE
jgi:hypothetical protein